MIYIVLKHPMHPYASGAHLAAGVIVSVHADKSAAQAVCAAKNQRGAFLYTVHAKRITKDRASK